MDATHTIVAVVVSLGLTVLWISALVSVIRSASIRPRAAAWAVVVVFPLVGPVVWFAIGRPIERAAREA